MTLSDHDATVYSKDEILTALHISNSGLTKNEAAKRLIEFGPNAASSKSEAHIAIEYLKNFSNPLVLILIAISGLSFFLGETLNASIIFIMIFMSTTLNFVQEHRAGKAAEKLAAKLITKTTVVRDSKTIDIPSSEIVPGDIVILNAGDLVPADGRIISSKDLFMNEASVTGESFPVEKHADADHDNLIKAGTSVVSGTGTIVIYKTGKDTVIGKITNNIGDETTNDFTKGTQDFGNFILKIVIIFTITIFFLHYLLRQNFIESLTFAVAMAVGLTPEFLPMIMTVTMSRGAIQMSKKGVIVKHLTSIPTFGSMEILATDKTGTLTEDHVRLVRCVDIDGRDSASILSYAFVNSSFQTGLTNPLDTAILEHKGEFLKGWSKIDEIPFDFERRRLSIIGKYQSQRILICKGAPEEILNVCTVYQDGDAVHALTPAKKTQIIKLFHSLSQDGFRVLGLATQKVQTKSAYSKQDEKDLIFQGFTAFLDPPKEGVLDSINRLEEKGVEVKIITGDNEIVTEKICRDVGIISKGTLLGTESEKMSDQELAKNALTHTIFARFSPIEKTRVIKALRSQNKVVGYLGDGINDALSLNAADVGISVNNAVDVAKESADFILTHKSLSILSEAVTEGRMTFGNTLKYIMMGLSSNFGNMFSVFFAVIYLPFLPMLPLQILLNNFLYDVSQLTIPFDNVDREYSATPKRWNIGFVRNFMLFMGPVSSIFDLTTFYVLYHLFHVSETVFQTGWFMESLATQTLVIYIIRTRKLSILKSLPHPLVMLSTTLVVLIGWALPFLHIGKIFSFGAPPLSVSIALIAITGTYLIATECAKHLFYRTVAKSQ